MQYHLLLTHIKEVHETGDGNLTVIEIKTVQVCFVLPAETTNKHEVAKWKQK